MFRTLARTFVDIIYPHKCPACKKVSSPGNCLEADICADCWRSISYNTPPFCSRCGRHLTSVDGATSCASCRNFYPAFDRAFSACVYDGTVKKLIHELKYAGKEYLGKPLGSLLIDFIRKYQLPVGSIDTVIALPLHRVRLREREFNQAHILAREVCAAFGLASASDALLKVKATGSQTDLSPEERALNVQGAFRVKDAGKITGKSILLVDDVLTTGATASEAAAALKQAHAAYVMVLTLAS